MASRACYSEWMNRPYTPGPAARCLAAALLVAVAAPGPARGDDGAGEPARLDDIAEVAGALPTGAGERPEELAARMAAAGRVYRVEVPAAAGSYDRKAGVFHVRLLTAEERILASVQLGRHGAFLARTREGLPFSIRRQDVTIYELEPLAGIELARDIAVPGPPAAARELSSLVAVCEFRVVAGADGLPARRTVEPYPTSITQPLDGKVTTYVVRVALDSVALRPAAPRPDRRLDEPPRIPLRTARAAMHD